MTNVQTPYIVGICGSLRPGSYTRMALAPALAGASEAGAKTELLDLSLCELPYCSGRTPAEDEHPAVQRLRELVENAHGFLWATPEYHGSFSGVLKNAIDLTDLELWRGKPIGLIGVSGGAQGANGALIGLRVVGQGVRALVLPGQVSIARVHKVFDPGPLPEELSHRLHGLGKSVVHYARHAR